MTSADLITCDSAEKKSTADYRSFGLFARDAEKGPGSVEYSMKWLGAFKIVIDPIRCPKTAQEFNDYELEKDKDGNLIGDAYKIAVSNAFNAESEKYTTENPAPFNNESEFISWLNQNDNELDYLDSQEAYTATFINSIQSEMAARTYIEVQEGFLWIKNIWIADSPFVSSISSYNSLASQMGKKNIGEKEEEI